MNNGLGYRTVYTFAAVLFCCLFSRVTKLQGKKHQNCTVSTETIHHESTYIIVFLTRHNGPQNDDEKTPYVSHSLCLRSADDVTSFTHCIVGLLCGHVKSNISVVIDSIHCQGRSRVGSIFHIDI